MAQSNRITRARARSAVVRGCARLGAANGGGAAMLVALAAPAVLLLALGAIQINAVVSDRQKTQDVADAAALWGAQQFVVTPEGAGSRTEAYAELQLDGVKANAEVRVKAHPIGKNSLKVTIDTHRPSFFMNLMPAGGFNTHVESIAEGVSMSPLCVLVLGGSAGDNVEMKNTSKLQGPQCMVHSNQAVMADGSALIQAKQVEAVTTASGPISPAAATGAPTIPDPFSGLSYNFPFPCLLNILDAPILLNTTLPPGVHQFNYRVRNGLRLTLAAGDHYFCGDVELKDGSDLVGDNVAMVFAPGAKFDTYGGGDVDLNGRKSGALAGFVLLASRTETNDFVIASDPISNITGTLYIPNAKLVVDGTKRAGQSSAWTVLAAERFEGRGGANLVINANYGGSDVPVPGGVGDKRAVTRLTK